MTKTVSTRTGDRRGRTFAGLRTGSVVPVPQR